MDYIPHVVQYILESVLYSVQVHTSHFPAPQLAPPHTAYH